MVSHDDFATFEQRPHGTDGSGGSQEISWLFWYCPPLEGELAYHSRVHCSMVSLGNVSWQIRKSCYLEFHLTETIGGMFGMDFYARIIIIYGGFSLTWTPSVPATMGTDTSPTPCHDWQHHSQAHSLHSRWHSIVVFLHFWSVGQGKPMVRLAPRSDTSFCITSSTHCLQAVCGWMRRSEGSFPVCPVDSIHYALIPALTPPPFSDCHCGEGLLSTYYAVGGYLHCWPCELCWTDQSVRPGEPMHEWRRGALVFCYKNGIPFSNHPIFVHHADFCVLPQRKKLYTCWRWCCGGIGHWFCRCGASSPYRWHDWGYWALPVRRPLVLGPWPVPVRLRRKWSVCGDPSFLQLKKAFRSPRGDYFSTRMSAPAESLCIWLYNWWSLLRSQSLPVWHVRVPTLMWYSFGYECPSPRYSVDSSHLIFYYLGEFFECLSMRYTLLPVSHGSPATVKYGCKVSWYLVFVGMKWALDTPAVSILFFCSRFKIQSDSSINKILWDRSRQDSYILSACKCDSVNRSPFPTPGGTGDVQIWYLEGQWITSTSRMDDSSCPSIWSWVLLMKRLSYHEECNLVSWQPCSWPLSAASCQSAADICVAPYLVMTKLSALYLKVMLCNSLMLTLVVSFYALVELRCWSPWLLPPYVEGVFL